MSKEEQSIRQLIEVAKQNAVNLDKLIDAYRESLRSTVGVAAGGNQEFPNRAPIASVGNVQ